MDKKKKVFVIVSILFVLAVLFISWDMFRRTTPPWEKKKEIIKKYE